MTNEEKAKAYDKALKKAKQLHTEDCSAEAKDACEYLFPELAESEDERIRKDIIEHFKYEIEELSNKGEEYEAEVEELSKYIAYLERQKDIITDYEDRLDRCACDNFNKGFKAGVEKQKEQNPAEWSGEEKRHFNTIIRAIHSAGNITPIEGELAEKWFKSIRQQPKQEWSEEELEDAVFDWLYEDGHCKWDKHDTICLSSNTINKLVKYFAINPHWKPSEEQMGAIITALKYIPNNKEEWEILDSLYEDLKKLM